MSVVEATRSVVFRYGSPSEYSWSTAPSQKECLSFVKDVLNNLTRLRVVKTFFLSLSWTPRENNPMNDDHTLVLTKSSLSLALPPPR